MLGEFIHAGKLFIVKHPHDPLSEDEMPCRFGTIKDAELFFKYAIANRFTCQEIIEITKWYLPFSSPSTDGCSSEIQEKRLNLLLQELVRGNLILVQKTVLTMTRAEREQCAKVYEIYTGIEMTPSRWNREAADLLGEMVRQVEQCSRALGTFMAFFPRELPEKGAWQWLAGIMLRIIENEAMIKKGYARTICLKTVTKKFEISIAETILQ